jgi:hypothetical protein
MTTASITNQAFSTATLKDLTRDINRIVKRPSYDQAVSIYCKARERLLDVDAWKSDSRLKEFDYTLLSNTGQRKTGFATEGDFIKYKSTGLPGELNCVKIERILEVSHDDWKSFAMRFKAVRHSEELSNASEFETNTIVLERSGNKVVSYLHQRVKDTGIHQPRNGIFSGFWKIFTGNAPHTGTQTHNWETLIDVILE